MRKLQKEVVSNATNADFFNLFFKSQNVTRLIGYFGQLVSGLTEFHFIYSGAGGVYSPWGQTSNVLPFLLGALVVYILEVVGVRVYLVRIVRQIANKQFKVRESRVLFGFNLLFVLALCGANLLFSWIGQKATFATKTNVTTTDKTHQLELEKTAKVDRVTARYDKKLEELSTTYQNDKTDITKRYDTDIKQLEKSQKKFKDLDWKYNQYTLKIDAKISDKTTDLSELKQTYNNDKNRLNKDRESQILTITNGYDKRINDVEKTEKANVNLWAMVQKYTLPILMVFIFLSWVAIIYSEVFYKGSGQKIEVKEVSSRPLLLWVLIVGLYDKFYHWFYSKVVNIIGLDKNQYSEIRTNEIKINPKELLNPQKVAAKTSTTNNPTIRKIGFGRNKDNQQQNHTTNNPTNIVNFSGPGTLTDGTDTPNIERLNGDRITVNVGELKDNERLCKNCGVKFTYKHWNARYCSDTCRIDSWEKRTGKKFNKKSKK